MLLPRFSDQQAGQMHLVGFADTGTVTLNKNPWFAGQNTRTLSGAGVLDATAMVSRTGLVGNGSLIHGEEELPQWSMVVVEPTEEKFEIRAGAKGVEALVLQYPREES